MIHALIALLLCQLAGEAATALLGLSVPGPVIGMLLMLGLAVGVASHGIGTARAFQVNPTAGAFAGLGMALNAVATAFVAPLVLALVR